MSAAQVAKLEVLLARVRERRLEPGLRLVDVGGATSHEGTVGTQAPTPAPAASAPAPVAHPAPVAAAAPAPEAPVVAAPVERPASPQVATSAAATSTPTAARPAPAVSAPAPVEPPAPVTSAPAPAERPVPVAPVAAAPNPPSAATAPAQPAQRASLLDLDEPVAARPASSAPGAQRVTMDVDPDDELFDVDVEPARPTPAKLELVESVDPDALVTAVARPAPTDVAVAAPPSAAAPTEAGSGVHSAGPIRMEAPVPVASGPVATFTGVAKRTHALSFGELVGLAMSLTTR